MSLYLDYEFFGRTESGKTCIWFVKSRGNSVPLGQVRWYGAWRKYVFYPSHDTLFDYACLQDIASFCQTNTKGHNA